MSKKYSSFRFKLIYVFRINDEAHNGCLKIGEATIEGDKHTDFAPNSKALNAAARERIKQYTHTAGIHYELLHTEIAVRGTRLISDHDVHKVLRRSGVKQKIFDKAHKRNEWFVCSLETARAAIAAALDNHSAINANVSDEAPDPIAFRDEQREAINAAVKHYRAGNTKYLWNAKMRFGKTLCALQVIKEMQFKRVIIFTHRPDVLDGWRTDFGKIFYEVDTNYRFCAKDHGTKLVEAEERARKDKDSSYIYFASTQDLRGSQQVGGKFDKNDEVFSTKWDLVIIDEAHEGLQTELGRNVRQALCGNDTHQLLLSGTPFNLFDEFGTDEMYTWDYVMEQRAKADWTVNHYGDSNPYDVLPVMHILTFSLGDMLNGEEEYADIDDKAFNFREFFRTFTGDPKEDRRPMPVGKKPGDFVHEADVTKFLNLLVTPNEDNNMPFSTDYFRENFRHTLWMVPGVKEGAALAKLLKKHDVFGQFTIVNVAGEGGVDDEVTNNKALEDVRAAITDHPEKTFTITLSCGKLTTGVNIKHWTAVFMLAGSYSTSAANYMQTIFRVQTPAVIDGRLKTDCYVFDFAPDRTLKVMAEAAQLSARAKKRGKADVHAANERELLGEFLNFCPIISYDGTVMRHFDVNSMMEHLKRVYVDRVVNRGFEDNHLYNDKLLQLDGLELQEFNRLKGIIGTSKANPRSNEVDVNHEGFTDEEHSIEAEIINKPKNKRTPEEEALLAQLREKRKNRLNAISILRGISIRMPLMIYGAELKDNEEITIDNFADKVDDPSWEEFMPRGVTKEIFAKFTKYYDADIFRAAGRQIRSLSRAADRMTVTERVQRISHIFSSFRNPDKETVLTPWRVVNMHLSDTIGGYCFFNDEFDDTLPEPRFVDRGEVTRNVFAPTDTHVLEINSKSGLYPLYVAYSIFRYRLDNKIGVVSDEQTLWDQILRDNLFVVCKTPMAKSITLRTLRGFRATRVNARYFDDLINQIRNKPDKFIKQMRQGRNYWNANSNNNMKFNAIVGNPPYQLMDGGECTSSTAIYPLFIDIASRIETQYITLITPSRWMTKQGRGLSENWAEQILSCNHFKYIKDYLDASDVFSNVEIKGGISYFLYSKKYVGDCEYELSQNGDVTKKQTNLNEWGMVIRDGVAESILRKVSAVEGKEYYIKGSFASIVCARHHFDQAEILSTGWRGYAENADNEHKIKCYLNKQLLSCGYGWVALQDVPKNHNSIAMRKIFISKAYGAGDSYPHQILGVPFYGEPNSVCTDTYIVIKPENGFKSDIECKNAISYIKTRFFRYLVFIKKKTQDAAREVYQFVPMQDFREEWTDEKLYAKYGLTDEEIAYIESMIKPM